MVTTPMGYYLIHYQPTLRKRPIGILKGPLELSGILVTTPRSKSILSGVKYFEVVISFFTYFFPFSKIQKVG